VPEDRPGFHFKYREPTPDNWQELVASDEIAVLELVKNAYDSNARKVTIIDRAGNRKESGFH